MMNATELKNQAAQAKRTGTALLSLSKRLVLGDADKNVLQRAAAILASAGSKVKSEAVSAKKKEVAKERAIAAATVEVKKIIATWPAETKIDKVAIIFANPFGYGDDNLRKYLEEKEGLDLEWYLNAMFDMAIKDIVDSAAYLVVKDGKPAVAIMEDARQRLEIIRAKPRVRDMAEQWEIKLKATAKS